MGFDRPHYTNFFGLREGIGYFRVAVNLIMKGRLVAKLSIGKLVLFAYETNCFRKLVEVNYT